MSKEFYRRGVLVAVLSISAMISAARADDRLIKIGAILAQTGPNASIGTESLVGAQYAVKRLNDNGGVSIGGQTYRFQLINIDDESKAERSVAAAEKLVADPDISVIMTPPSSTTTLAVMPVAEKNNRIALSFVAADPHVTGPEHPLSFRTTLTSTMNVSPSVEFLMKEKGVKKIAYIGRNDDWGRAAAKNVADTAARFGGQVVMTEFFETGSTDFYGVLTKARAANPDAVVGAAFIEDGVSLIKQYRELQIERPFLSVAVIWGSPTFLKAAGEDANGVYISTGPTTSKSADIDAFQAKFKADTGAAALPYNITAVDNVNLIVAAMQKAGSTDPKKVADVLRNFEFKGLLQTYKFDNNNQSQVVININQVNAGKIDLISSLVTN